MFEPEYGDHLIGSIQTVLGPVPKSDLGITLMHEHVLVDQQAKERTERIKKEKEEINILKQDVNEIKDMLRKLLEQNNG